MNFLITGTFAVTMYLPCFQKI